MPMLDVTIPEGALAPDREAALLDELTDILLEHEGADKTNPVVRQIAWVFLNKPAQVFVAGAPADAPRYRVQASVPQGQFDDERRAGMVAAVTDAILRAEGIAEPTAEDRGRVWVFCHDVPEGTWGAGGRINRLADIVTFAGVEREKAERYAARRLAASRGEAPVGTPA